MKRYIEGFNNSQRIRFILKSEDGSEVGMYITIKDLGNFATSNARAAVWDACIHLGFLRRTAESVGECLPTSVVRKCFGFAQVQVDLLIPSA